jgi:hypothetical protein
MEGPLTRRWLLGVAASALTLALPAVSPPAPASAQPTPGIGVYGQGGAPLATFRTLRCALRPTRTRRREFTAIGSSGGWNLFIGVSPFSGYRNYSIPWGVERDDPTYFSVRGPGGIFSPTSKPAGAILPPSGGSVTFPSGRRRVGLGFVNAWNPGITSAVTIAGVAGCTYRARRR